MPPEHLARGVGIITAPLGVALAAKPEAVGRLVGMTGKRTAQVIGLADLALVPGLLVGRPRWPWMAARGVLNLVIAGAVRPQLAGSPRPKLLRAVLILLAAVTVADGVTAVQLRSAER